MGIDVFVNSLTDQWSDVPLETLRKVSVGELRRADPESLRDRPSRAPWFALPWSDGRTLLPFQRRKLLSTYIARLASRTGTTPWIDGARGPDAYGTRLDPAGLLFLRTVAIAASDGTFDAASVIAATHEPTERRDFFTMVERYVAAHAEAISAAALARFPNLLMLDIANLYLPGRFDGVWLGGAHDVGSAARFADELRELAALLGIDTRAIEWWNDRELTEVGPRSMSLYNLQVLGAACALAARANLPIIVSG